MSKFLYGATGGPKNNGRFSYIDACGRFRVGSSNRPMTRVKRLQLFYAGPINARERKWVNMYLVKMNSRAYHERE